MSAFTWDDSAEFFDSDWQEPVTYAGTIYQGIRMSKELSNSTLPAGLSSNVKFRFMFKVSDFVTLPTNDTLMTVGSEELRINAVDIDSTNKTFTVQLSEKYGA